MVRESGIDSLYGLEADIGLQHVDWYEGESHITGYVSVGIHGAIV